MNTFADFARAFCASVSYISKQGARRINFVMDSYIEKSKKFVERLNRYKSQSIDIHVIHENVPIPKEEKLFWGSNRNKTLLQNFIRRYILEKSSNIWPNLEVVCIATNELP